MKPLPTLGVIALFLFGTTNPAFSQDFPNLIFILADDMGYGDVSHEGGLAETPHLDRMAEEGVRFMDAHTTSSVCTPTRYSILTGRYNWRSELKKSVLFGLSEPLIPDDRMTVADLLKKRGYRTGIVGKWHLGLGWQKLPDGEVREAVEGETKGEGWDIDYTKRVSGGPLALGFDESFIIPASLDMFPYIYLKDDVPTAEATVTKAFHRPGPSAADFEAIRCLEDFARESRDFIARAAKAEDEKPFFLYLPLTSPHTPIVPAEKWQGKSPLGDYGDFVMETDWVVGEVLAELEKQGVDDNTMVLFTTDNGCSPAADIPNLVEQGHMPNAHWRGHKADIYEGGHRVPFLVRWPERIPEGEVKRPHLVSTVDYFATVAEITGGRKGVPARAAEDSISFLPVLEGKTSLKRRPFLIHHSINGSFAIRQGKWKLALCPGSGGWSDPRPNKALKDESLPPIQLFDLKADPEEANNLADKNPAVVDRLAGHLAAAIRRGRTTPGAEQSNDGWPDTIPEIVLERLPVLEEGDAEESTVFLSKPADY